MNAIVEQINSGGYAFVEFAASMLIQASVLIVLLFLADLALRKRVRAVFRYWMWLLVLVKLVLPTSLSGPFSIGYWFGDNLEYADVGRGAYEPQAAGPMMPALPYIDISNVPPAIYPPVTSPALGEVDVTPAQPIARLSVRPVQIEWQGVVFLLWLAIVIALLLLLAQRAIFVHGLVAQAREASRPMYDALEECRNDMKVRAKVGLKVSPNAASPAVCGLLRPAILVPNNLSAVLGSEDLRVVLLHELAHIKRGDLWINLAQTLLQIVYFYNPLLWLANAVIRRAREQAVDEVVLVAMGEKARRYPQTLVSVAKLAFKRPGLSLRLIGVVESKSALTARIKRILSRPIPKSAKLGILGLAVIVITAVILLPMAKAQPYTDRARQVMALAEQEARRLKHEYVGTEHILLALSRQEEGVGGQVLQKLGIRTETVEGELAKLVKTGSRPVTKASLPQTPRVKKALELAEQEAKALDHDYIGTEHILLGLMRETDGLAAQIVTNLGVSYEVVREGVLGFVKPGANASLGEALRCELKIEKPKVVFGEQPLFTATLTNGGSEPVNVMGYGDEQEGHPSYRLPLAGARLEIPGYGIQGYDAPGAEPRAVRIGAGESWSFEAPPPRVPRYADEPAHPLPNLQAYLPGKHTAQVIYSIGDYEKDRFGPTLVFGADTGALAGKKPEKLWEGTVRSNAVTFEVLEDDSEALRIRRAVDSGEGIRENLSLELTCPATQIEMGEGTQLNLTAKNPGSNMLYLGSNCRLNWKGPDGRERSSLGLGTAEARQVRGGGNLVMGGWSFGSGQAPVAGIYQVWVEYAPGQMSDKVLAKSNVLTLEFVEPGTLAKSARPFTATLANGVTVEVVGVCEHPSEGKQWWGLNGQPIAKPYERLNYNERSADSKLYEVAYRLFGWDDILSTIYSNSEITGHISLYPLSQKTEKLNILDAANAYGAILLVKPDAQSIQLEMGIGRDSDWKTLCTQASPVDKTGTAGPGVVFQPAIEKDGKTHITIAHQIKDRQIRVIAVDHSGQIHESEGFLNTISGELGSCQVRFNLPAAQIKEIQFQTQKFERVTFENISLRPGAKTDVEIKVESEKISGVVGVQDSTLGKSTSAEAAFIIQKVLDRYAAIKTYSAIGELLTEVNHPPGGMVAIPGMTTEMLQQMGEQQLKSIFTIKMARPNLYCIEWNEHIDTNLSKVGNAWSVGDGSYGLILGKEKSFEKPLQALIWTASDMGKVQSSLFFDTSLNTLRVLRDLSQQEDEQLEGVECYVISGSRYRRTYTYWVSKKDFLIRRYKFVSGGDGKLIEGGGHELTEETIKGSLNAMDKEATPEKIAKTRATLTAANAMASEVKVTNTETYRNIILDQPISKEQFVPSKDIDEITEELKNLRTQYIHRLGNISPTEPNLKTDVQVEVETPDEKAGVVWGEAVEGVQMRVRPQRQRWYEGETPKFLVDMRNNGTVELELVLAQEHWEVELDGLWYKAGATFTGRVPTLLLGPGQEHKDIEFYPGVWSRWNINDKPLKFTPGWHTVRLSFGPSTRDRAYWRRLRVVSNAVVIEVLPKGEKPGTVEVEADALGALQAELDELRRQRQDIAAAETFGKRLLEKYTEREERSLVYYQLAEMYAQGGQINPGKVVEYAEAGWWYLHDPVKRARLFVYWGDALQLSRERREAARIYLRGLEFCLQFGLPKDKPERPAAPYALDGPKEAAEQYGKANQPEMAAWKQARRIEELIEHRNVLTGKIVRLYAQAPDAFDELHELAVKYLSSEQAAQQLIAAAKAYRTNPSAAIPVITRIGPDPDPDADLHWGQPSEGIRVRLRAETRRWAANDAPKLKLDVRNDGSRILALAPDPECWGLEVDGVWYKAAIPMLGGAKGMSFGPGKRWYNLELSLAMALDPRNDSGGLELSPGWHTIRAALAAGLSEDRVLTPVAALSNPVEIDVVPMVEEDATRAEAGARLSSVVASEPWTKMSRNWPGFRGPSGAGISALANAPANWDGRSGKGILWKSPVPLGGKNSPIVWGGRVFVSGGKGDLLEVYCFDASSGRLLWTGVVPMTKPKAGEKFEVMEDTGLAASTMVTDGGRVCAIFATGDLACFDFSGRRLWMKSLGLPRNTYGHASSLSMYRNLVIVQFDQAGAEDGRSKIIALDAASGNPVWETSRPVANSWCSPILVQTDSGLEIITASDPWVIAYEPGRGAEIWRAKCLAGDIAASPIYANGLTFVVEPYSKIAAIRTNGKDDVTKTHIVWSVDEPGPDICSLVSNGEYVFGLNSDGLAICLNAADGKKLWEEDIREDFLASPSLVGDKLYLLTENGVMIIAEVGPQYKELRRCELGEKCFASPAFADGRIYIRGQNNLYCIGNTESISPLPHPDEERTLGRKGGDSANVDFDELSVKFGGMWIGWHKPEFTIRADGSAQFSMNKGPNDNARYATTFNLSREHLAQLTELLQKTTWLTAPGVNEQPGYTDATRIDMSLTREGEVREVWCHDRNPEPYLSLINFLKRVHQQEFLLNRMVAAGDDERVFAFREIDQQMRAERGEQVAAPAHGALDYSRFVPPSVDVIGRPDDNHHDTIAAALKLLGMVRTEQAREQITNLTTGVQKQRQTTAGQYRTEVVREAAIRALTVLGGEQARQHIRDMAKNRRSWGRMASEALVESLLELDRDNCVGVLKDMVAATRQAAWGLIRLGSAGVPATVEILEARDLGDMGQIYLIRQYIDNWEQVPKPVDARVIEAVQRNLDYRLGYSHDWTEYHKEFLQLACTPQLPSKDTRQIVEEFLAAVKANDQMTIGGITNSAQSDWLQRLAELKILPELQRLKAVEVYADVDDNMAQAVAAAPGPGNENSARVRIILNFVSGSVWRVVNIAIETPEVAERMTERFLEKHPRANPVPAISAEPASAWGEDVKGLRAAVECVPDKEEYAFGEKIGLRFHIQNASDDPIQFVSSTRRQGHTAIVEDENGKAKSLGSTWYSGWVPMGRYYLEPAEEVVLQTTSRSRAFAIPSATSLSASRGPISFDSR